MIRIGMPMVITLRPIHQTAASAVKDGAQLHAARPAASETDPFGVALMRMGRISAAPLMAALSQPQIPLIDHLITQGTMSETDAYSALAAHCGVGLADFTGHPIDVDLIARADAAVCLAGHWTPWCKLGTSTVIVCAYPEGFVRDRTVLTRLFGTVVLALAPRRAIEAQIMARSGAALARRAETLLPIADSCRNFSPQKAYIPIAVLGACAVGAALAAPLSTLAGVMGFALLLAYVQTALKLCAAAMALLPRAQPRPLHQSTPHLRIAPNDADLPMISIMVPLLRESRIVARLIRRLDQLDYPRAALDVILLTEEGDSGTASALASIRLPSWVRVLCVPSGTIRTKPRALNYGMDHCKGTIIGVYDAEDAPQPDQLRAVAAGFDAGGPRLACLQGRLDYYNPHSNWLSRCFTIEYAAWWRVLLPGFARMGFALPLGGTTLFFRRDTLVTLGGWDAHNVTEDADLGLRLARRGYQTHLLDSTTYEEANCRALPWIKQRSRWIKGYIMTYASHMRSPRNLLRDLGGWRFFGMQMMFAGTVVQALLAPLLPALWLVSLGLIDLRGNGLAMLASFAALGILAEAAMLTAAYAGIRRTGHTLSPLWLPTMMIYNLLASLAAYKAVYEVLTKPFYWDKTAHGLFDD